MKIRGKFALDSIVLLSAEGHKKFNLVNVLDEADENGRHLRGPYGRVEVSINNKAAQDQFQFGRLYYVDITPVEEEDVHAT